MENVKIYLAGGMTGLSLEEQTKWRIKFRDAVKYGGFEYEKNPIIFDPTQHYSLFDHQQKSEKEVMEFDLYNLKRSDLIVVNFNVPNSIGTAMELMVAKEHNIPVIGLNKNKYELHSWLTECCTRICDDFRELVNHTVDFYLK